MPKKQQSYGVYGESEMKFMKWLHGFKAGIFRPVMSVLNAMGVSANGLSVFGAVVAGVGFVLSFWLGEAWYFIGGVWVHMIIDALDGTLARYQGKINIQGSYIDAVSDHFVIVLASIFAFYFMNVDFVWVILYTIFYTFVNFSAFVLSYIGHPFGFLIRPRIYIYSIFLLDLLAGTEWTPVIFYAGTTVLAVAVIDGVMRLKRAL